jgi:hypothetical protein
MVESRMDDFARWVRRHAHKANGNQMVHADLGHNRGTKLLNGSATERPPQAGPQLDPHRRAKLCTQNSCLSACG